MTITKDELSDFQKEALELVPEGTLSKDEFEEAKKIYSEKGRCETFRYLKPLMERVGGGSKTTAIFIDAFLKEYEIID